MNEKDKMKTGPEVGETYVDHKEEYYRGELHKAPMKIKQIIMDNKIHDNKKEA